MDFHIILYGDAVANTPGLFKTMVVGSFSVLLSVTFISASVWILACLYYGFKKNRRKY